MSRKYRGSVKDAGEGDNSSRFNHQTNDQYSNKNTR